MSDKSYAPCPCGSGEKLKFCCADIAPEMNKALDLLSRDQLRSALRILEKLLAEHPGRSWVVTTYAAAQLSQGHNADVRDILKPLLAASPKDGLARVLDAMAAFGMYGYDGARKEIHQAIQHGMPAHADMIASLLVSAAQALDAGERWLAARQHLMLALKFAPEQLRENFFNMLVEFDNEIDIPFPMRGGSSLPAYQPDDPAHQKDHRKAIQLLQFGFFMEANGVLTKLAESLPDAGRLWHQIAFARVSDGDETGATEALEKTAQLIDDELVALDCEVLAMLLKCKSPALAALNVSRSYGVPSASRLLSLFDDVPQFNRVGDDEQNAEDAEEGVWYLVTDKAAAATSGIDIPFEDLPRIVGRVAVQAHAEHGHTHLHLTAEDAAHLDRIAELIPDSVWNEAGMEDSPEFLAYGYGRGWPLDLVPLRTRAFIPNKLLLRMAESVGVETARRFVEQWPDRPLAMLDGKTPRQLAAQPETERQARAAGIVLLAYAERLGVQLDLNALWQSIGLVPLVARPADDKFEPASQSLTQLLFLDAKSLPTEALQRLTYRVMKVRVGQLLTRFAPELLSRENELTAEEKVTILGRLAQVYCQAQQFEAALDCTTQAFELARDGGVPAMASWKLQELLVRMRFQSRDEIRDFIADFHRQYLRKLPQMLSLVMNVMDMLGISPPWESSPLAVGGGLWTPGQPVVAEASTGSSVSKLWVPGQD